MNTTNITFTTMAMIARCSVVISIMEKGLYELKHIGKQKEFRI